ncbi:chemosensory receptor a [Plakobranchus ocellatus]|uniref:Chemosensory receptor a n=1 Tax=Plakobranchus ocellatus TaxID=259542 RepID=A0AAV3ZWK0_9GAST|nr:chemosensory receptor a [Plakobranchus ocellatus]
MDVRIPFDATNVSFLTGSMPWAFISRTVAWITALVSFERCLRILVPLKVKKTHNIKKHFNSSDYHFPIHCLSRYNWIYKLRKLSSWRKSVTSAKIQWKHKPGENPAPNSPPTQERSFCKEERLVGIVVAIATIFIVSYTPTCIMLLCSTIFDEFFFFGVYKRMFIVCGMATFLAQTISVGVNILIYYYMASKFRSALRCLLCLDRQ